METKTKPVIEMTDAVIQPERLVGEIDRHPVLSGGELLTDRIRLRTSAIVKRNGDIIETENTIYHVKNWL